MEKKRRIVMAPSYMREFTCIGGKCEDTCCAGWYIAIDEGTYKKYKKIKDPQMKKRLDKELVARKGVTTPDHVAKIKLKNGRCAFLNGEGWCDIYSHLGESYLSHTCTLYPRTINQINDTLEYSVTFSCPEAARKILLNPEGIQFEQVEGLGEAYTISANLQLSTKKQKWQDYLLELRNWMIQLLQDRSYSLEDRLLRLGQEMVEINALVKRGELKKVLQTLERLEEQRKSEIGHIKGSLGSSKEAIALAKYLDNLSKEKKLQSVRYLECLSQILSGLGFDEAGQVVLEEGKLKYETGYNLYYKSFLEEKGYILENYLVNYIFERCIPLDGHTPMESFERMILYYKLIRMHLVGLAIAHQGLTDELVVRLIQSFSKIFDHNEEYIRGLLGFARYID